MKLSKNLNKPKLAKHMFWVFSMIISIANPVFGLQFTIHPNNSEKLNAILASGDIEDGDARKLVELLETLPEKANTAVYLASNGGSLIEGMELGLVFRKNRVKTVVEGGEICASACALAFLGGTDRSGKPWRSSSDNSLLGFHAFYASEDQDLTSDQVQQIVGLMLIYAKKVEAPLETLIAAFMTPSDQMYYLSQADICSLGIKLWSNKNDRFVCR